LAPASGGHRTRGFALGTASADPEVQREPGHPGDAYLLCSDGLSEVLAPAEAACRALVDAAYEAGQPRQHLGDRRPVRVGGVRVALAPPRMLDLAGFVVE
jgi:hypothetical protein